MDYNKVIMIGRLGSKPMIKTLNNSQMAQFSIANSIRWLDKATSEYKERTNWHKIVVYGDRLVEKCLKLDKGDEVLIEGYLDNLVVQKKDSVNGENITINRIVVDGNQGKIIFGRKKENKLDISFEESESEVESDNIPF